MPAICRSIRRVIALASIDPTPAPLLRDGYDAWNLVFNGIGAVITLLGAIIAVISFFIARASKKAAAAAEARALAAQQAEARTRGFLGRALRLFSPFSDSLRHSDDSNPYANMDPARRAHLEASGLPMPEPVNDSGEDSFEKILRDLNRSGE